MATTPGPSVPLTVDQLVERASHRLDAAGVRPASGQAAPRLTVRNVRYYASLGLLDPPAGHRGRQALYDQHHVDQLVAVRRLQADGLQLVEIERALADAHRDELARLAAGQAQPERFWARRTATPSTRRPRGPAPRSVASAGAAVAATPAPAAPADVLAEAGGADVLAEGGGGADAGAQVHGTARGEAVELARATAAVPSAPTGAPPPSVPPPAAAVVVDLGHGVHLQVPLDRPPISPEQVDAVLSRARAALLAPTLRRRPDAGPPPADQERSR